MPPISCCIIISGAAVLDCCFSNVLVYFSYVPFQGFLLWRAWHQRTARPQPPTPTPLDILLLTTFKKSNLLFESLHLLLLRLVEAWELAMKGTMLFRPTTEAFKSDARGPNQIHQHCLVIPTLLECCLNSSVHILFFVLAHFLLSKGPI